MVRWRRVPPPVKTCWPSRWKIQTPRISPRAIDAIRKLLVAESNIARELAALAYTHPELGLTTPTPEERLRILPTLETPHSDSDRAAVNAAIGNLFGNGNGDPYYKLSHEGRK